MLGRASRSGAAGARRRRADQTLECTLGVAFIDDAIDSQIGAGGVKLVRRVAERARLSITARSGCVLGYSECVAKGDRAVAINVTEGRRQRRRRTDGARSIGP